MLLKLTEGYVASKFFQYCGKPTFNRSQKTYQGSCPICREGTSWLKKRRCYYIVSKNSICCHNCGWYSTPYQWVIRVSGMSYGDIKKDLETGTEDIVFNNIPNKQEKKPSPALPADSINLLDAEQVNYFNESPIIQQCVELVKNRRLSTAINRPKALFTTTTDKVHSNRLIIPFYDLNGKIIFYQSRTVLKGDDRSKYLSKVGAERSLYGIDNVNTNTEYLFLTEGPIDAMFIQNGVGIAGINESVNKNFTEAQTRQLNGFPLHTKVWVLDNQLRDNTSKIKSNKLLDEGERVFIWPESFIGYKDINEYCIDKGINSFDVDTILENTYTGLKGKLLLKRN